MATLPTSTQDLSAGVRFEEQPSRTWYINKETNRIQGECDGLEAVRQAVEIILNVERFRWQIYSPYSGMQWEGLIARSRGTGSPSGYGRPPSSGRAGRRSGSARRPPSPPASSYTDAPPQ